MLRNLIAQFALLVAACSIARAEAPDGIPIVFDGIFIVTPAYTTKTVGTIAFGDYEIECKEPANQVICDPNSPEQVALICNTSPCTLTYPGSSYPYRCFSKVCQPWAEPNSIRLSEALKFRTALGSSADIRFSLDNPRLVRTQLEEGNDEALAETVDLLYMRSHGSVGSISLYEVNQRAHMLGMRLGDEERGTSVLVAGGCSTMSRDHPWDRDRAWLAAFKGGLRIGLGHWADSVSTDDLGAGFATRLASGYCIANAWALAGLDPFYDLPSAAMATHEGDDFNECINRLGSIKWTDLYAFPRLRDGAIGSICHQYFNVREYDPLPEWMEAGRTLDHTSLKVDGNLDEFGRLERYSRTNGLGRDSVKTYQFLPGQGYELTGSRVLARLRPNKAALTLDQRGERVRYATDDWELFLSKDGDVGEYFDHTARQLAVVGSAERPGPMPAEIIVGLAQSYLESNLAFLKDPESQWQPTFVRYTVSGFRPVAGGPGKERITESTVVFKRVLDGIVVLGRGSTVTVSLDNSGTVTAFSFDWPQLRRLQQTERVANRKELVGRIQRATSMRPPIKGSESTLDAVERMACGYVDFGQQHRGISGSTLQAGCFVRPKTLHGEARRTEYVPATTVENRMGDESEL